jgi:hypothetical protein
MLLHALSRSLQAVPKLATPARKVIKDLPRSSAVRRGERPEAFRAPKTSHSVDGRRRHDSAGGPQSCMMRWRSTLSRGRGPSCAGGNGEGFPERRLRPRQVHSPTAQAPWWCSTKPISRRTWTKVFWRSKKPAAEAFIKACGKLRFWAREAKVHAV